MDLSDYKDVHIQFHIYDTLIDTCIVTIARSMNRRKVTYGNALFEAHKDGHTDRQRDLKSFRSAMSEQVVKELFSSRSVYGPLKLLDLLLKEFKETKLDSKELNKQVGLLRTMIRQRLTGNPKEFLQHPRIKNILQFLLPRVYPNFSLEEWLEAVLDLCEEEKNSDCLIRFFDSFVEDSTGSILTEFISKYIDPSKVKKALSKHKESFKKQQTESPTIRQLYTHYNVDFS